MPEKMVIEEAMNGKPATGDPWIKNSIKMKISIIKPINENSKPTKLTNFKGNVEKPVIIVMLYEISFFKE